MTKLVYFSPVAWGAPKQRSHAFVEWFHKETDMGVVWVEPTVIRFPKLSDLRNIKTHLETIESLRPKWLEVVEPVSIPIEPFSLYDRLMHGNWIRFRRSKFPADENYLLVIGLPSKLALFTQKNLPTGITLYDVMDNFSAFHRGFSAKSINRVEAEIARRADLVICSSRSLFAKFRALGVNVEIVQNGSNGSAQINKRNLNKQNKNIKFCYLGTVGDWFDWSYLVKLAKARPEDDFTIIGPVYNSPRLSLPKNIKLLGALPHAKALEKLREFDVGLIPFKINELTQSVDAVKLYEYQDAGLVVLSSRFGGIEPHKDQNGIVIYQDDEKVEDTIFQIHKASKILESSTYDLKAHTWSTRFGGSSAIRELIDSARSLK